MDSALSDRRGEPADEPSDDALVVTYQPRGRAKRRYVFEPLTGDLANVSESEYLRKEQVWSRGEWRGVGLEHVDSVTVQDGRVD